jgi:PadR family transcriptional regulator, regulatory protein PadR
MGAAHGHTIAHAIERGSEDVLQIEHGSLYPALDRLENRGWIMSFWDTSDNNRKAKYYRLTPLGRKQLAVHTSRLAQHSSAVSPDGKWMAYASNETGRYEVWMEPIPQTGTRYQLTRDSGSHSMWLPE